MGRPSQALRASSPRGGAKELTCVSFVLMPDGRAVPAGELTAGETAEWRARLRERLSESMGEYYAQHPQELEALA